VFCQTCAVRTVWVACPDVRHGVAGEGFRVRGLPVGAEFEGIRTAISHGSGSEVVPGKASHSGVTVLTVVGHDADDERRVRLLAAVPDLESQRSPRRWIWQHVFVSGAPAMLLLAIWAVLRSLRAASPSPNALR
jgi:hypothetical protein